MRAQLSLALAGDHLTLTVSQPAQTSGLIQRLRSLAGFNRRRVVAAAKSPAFSAQITVTLPAGQLTETLEQAWSTLLKRCPLDLKALDLSVQLGLAHAHIDLLHLAEESANATKSTVIDSYAQAWIRQMRGIDPATLIMRWERVENSNDILLSCIDQSTYLELEGFSRRHGLRFVSCKPAVLSALDPQIRFIEPDATETTIVWTEPESTGKRASLVQLLHCDGARPKALWRGWLPAAESNDESDVALRGAVRRFTAATKLPGNLPVVFMPWQQVTRPPKAAGARS